MKHDSTFDELVKALIDQEAMQVQEDAERKVKPMVESASGHVRIFFEELLKREMEVYERHRKIRDRYLDLLEDYYYRSGKVLNMRSSDWCFLS
jgi:hypothetical protein